MAKHALQGRAPSSLSTSKIPRVLADMHSRMRYAKWPGSSRTPQRRRPRATATHVRSCRPCVCPARPWHNMPGTTLRRATSQHIHWNIELFLFPRTHCPTSAGHGPASASPGPKALRKQPPTPGMSRSVGHLHFPEVQVGKKYERADPIHSDTAGCQLGTPHIGKLFVHRSVAGHRNFAWSIQSWSQFRMVPPTAMQSSKA